MTARKSPASYGIDPWVFLGPRDSRFLRDSNAHERIALTDLVIEDLRAHPGTRRNALGQALLPQGTFERIRERVVDESSGVTVDQLINRLENGWPHLDRLIELLLSVVDRRAALLEQVRQLDAIATALGAPPSA